MANRRVPIGRLVRKLGLSRFENKGPLIDDHLSASRVVLPLKQHVGAPAEPTVKVGDTVEAGDVIAKPPAGQLGAVLHASIAGRVVGVSDAVVIEKS
jgi:Na+-translocating ferredoxin:NAD+ oxidoreductase RnfC subunit